MAFDSIISTIHRQRFRINTTNHLINREYDESQSTRIGTHLIKGRFETANNLYRKDLYAHFGCVNAIEFSGNGQWMVSGGDDRRVLLWNVEKAVSNVGTATVMKGEHNSNIFCLGFDSQCNRLFSAGNDELVMIHDTQTGETLDVILHSDAIYGISVDPIDDNIFASACDDGTVSLWDIRGSSRDPFILARCNSAFHAVVYNPFESRLVATANAKEGVALWDVRKPRCVLQQFTSTLLPSQSAMSVRFNKQGTLLLALRRRLPPVLYRMTSKYPVVEFDSKGYYNSCTMKSCSFGGDSDQYVLSGSDDFKLYLWKIPDRVTHNDLSYADTVWVGNANLVLKGHRSIVNQVRYNYANSIIASSGVEKVIKLWSSFPLPYGTGGLETNDVTQRDNRKVFTHEDYINLVLESGQFVSHDYSHQSVQEDPRMIAFFDSLVQRDIEGWTSDSSEDSNGCTSSFYELSWNNAVYSDESNSASNTPNSSVNDSDNEEMLYFNNHIVSCINVLTKRIKANQLNENVTHDNGVSQTNDKSLSSDEIKELLIRKKKNSNPELSSEVKRLPKESDKSQNELSVSHEPLNRENNSNCESNEFNRISKLINEKKRDQLRKIAKMTVRAAKKRLKRIQRYIKPNNTNGDHKADDNFEIIQEKLNFLSQQLECQSINIENKTERCSSRRIHKRLRFLTNQSDLVFNEVLPIVSSSSDSESSTFVSGDELYDVLTNEVERMRHMLPNDSDADSSDSDSGYENLIQLKETLEKVSSSSSDEEPIKETGDGTKEEHKHRNNAKNIQIALKARFDESNDSDDEETATNSYVHDTLIHCPYKHNLCHASTSSAPGNDAIKKPIVFRPIDTRRRSYRKRKRSTNGDRSKKDKHTNEKKNE